MKIDHPSLESLRHVLEQVQEADIANFTIKRESGFQWGHDDSIVPKRMGEMITVTIMVYV